MPPRLILDESSALASLGDQADRLDVDVRRGAWKAAEAYVSARCSWPVLDSEGAEVGPPEDLVQAVKLMTSRYLSRRSSPAGVLGSGDFGVVRVSGSDRDVDALMAPWRKTPLG